MIDIYHLFVIENGSFTYIFEFNITAISLEGQRNHLFIDYYTPLVTVYIIKYEHC